MIPVENPPRVFGYNDLPKDIQRLADEQFSLFAANPQHPSIQLKPVGEFWSARITDAYRALAIREENVFTWFWIGPHDEYERLLGSDRADGTAVALERLDAYRCLILTQLSQVPGVFSKKRADS